MTNYQPFFILSLQKTLKYTSLIVQVRFIVYYKIIDKYVQSSRLFLIFALQSASSASISKWSPLFAVWCFNLRIQESGQFNTLSLRFVAKIPGLQSNNNWSAYHSKLFALNSELHFTNGEKIFVLQNEHPVCVKSKIGSFYYSFLDIALRWSPKQAVYQVMNNYDERLILEINDVSCISHCSGGIIILHSVEWETANVINMITLEIKKFEGRPELKQKNIHSIMEVNKFGYCLTEAATEDLLGIEFVQQREFLWNEYFQEQKEAFAQINFSELLNNNENEEEENEEEPEKETLEQKIDKIENTLQEMKKQMNRFEKQQDLIVELLSRICK
ncbi:Conserved_hypothetical protein [Hexamita inflata]|uniref:Uncharacterized protein n=1 Tax=Hexamita inflata TaxID=28002 RepID=A0ABP1JU26_9EUKA